jgi:hypothetical protein
MIFLLDAAIAYRYARSRHRASTTAIQHDMNTAVLAHSGLTCNIQSHFLALNSLALDHHQAYIPG